MSKDRRTPDDVHLPASEADSEFFEHADAPAAEDVRMPASEEDAARLRLSREDAGRRPGKGRPGTIPPPD